MRGGKTLEQATDSSDDAVFCNYCSIICSILSVGLFLASIYGIVDGIVDANEEIFEQKKA